MASPLSEDLFGYVPGICAMNYQSSICQLKQTYSSNADYLSFLKEEIDFAKGGAYQ